MKCIRVGLSNRAVCSVHFTNRLRGAQDGDTHLEQTETFPPNGTVNAGSLTFLFDLFIFIRPRHQSRQGSARFFLRSVTEANVLVTCDRHSDLGRTSLRPAH